MSVPSLRAAATSILMARDPLRNSFVVLLVQRSESSKFMPGVHVFPGGVLDKADENPAWQSILDVSSSTLPQTLDRVVGGDCLPMRIACVRELFEEAGILLCEPPADRVPQAGPTLCSAVPSSLSATVQPPLSVSFSLKDFRSRLLTDPALFYSDIVQQRKLVPRYATSPVV